MARHRRRHHITEALERHSEALSAVQSAIDGAISTKLRLADPSAAREVPPAARLSAAQHAMREARSSLESLWAALEE